MIIIQTPTQRLDVIIRHHVPRPMRNQKTSNLCFINLPFILCIHGLEQLSYLQVTFSKLHAHNPCVKLLYLSLCFPFYLNFAFQKFSKSAENIIGALFDILYIFSSYLLEKFCGYFLV